MIRRPKTTQRTGHSGEVARQLRRRAQSCGQSRRATMCQERLKPPVGACLTPGQARGLRHFPPAAWRPSSPKLWPPGLAPAQPKTREIISPSTALSFICSVFHGHFGPAFCPSIPASKSAPKRESQNETVEKSCHIRPVHRPTALYPMTPTASQ